MKNQGISLKKNKEAKELTFEEQAISAITNFISASGPERSEHLNTLFWEWLETGESVTEENTRCEIIQTYQAFKGLLSDLQGIYENYYQVEYEKIKYYGTLTRKVG